MGDGAEDALADRHPEVFGDPRAPFGERYRSPRPQRAAAPGKVAPVALERVSTDLQFPTPFSALEFRLELADRPTYHRVIKQLNGCHPHPIALLPEALSIYLDRKALTCLEGKGAQ